MFRLSSALKAKGEKAEKTFQYWLNRSGVAFLYVEQSPLSIPVSLRGRIKRPDYLVGVPNVGALAFDVKAKRTYGECLLFQAAEVRKLNNFSRFFNISVFLACLDLERPERFYCVALQDLTALPTERRGKAEVFVLPVTEAKEVHIGQWFAQVFLDLSLKTMGHPN